MVVRALSQDGRQETFCSVYVNVIYENDSPPLFAEREAEVTIDEDTSVGTTIITVKADDMDLDPTNSRIYYSLPDSNNNFAVHPTNGQVFLTSLLRYDVQSVHSINILASDRTLALQRRESNPASMILRVTVTTVNRHAPTVNFIPMSDYYVTKQRPIGVDDVYAVIEVDDSDSGRNGIVSKPRISGNDEYFSIESGTTPKTFNLVCIRDLPTENVVYNLTLQVSDKGSPRKITRLPVQIPLLDFESLVPQFDQTPYLFNVSQLSPAQTDIGRVRASVSGDVSGSVEYSIINYEPGLFVITRKTGMLRTATAFNSLKSTSFSFDLEDLGNIFYDSK